MKTYSVWIVVTTHYFPFYQVNSYLGFICQFILLSWENILISDLKNEPHMVPKHWLPAYFCFNFIFVNASSWSVFLFPLAYKHLESRYGRYPYYFESIWRLNPNIGTGEKLLFHNDGWMKKIPCLVWMSDQFLSDILSRSVLKLLIRHSILENKEYARLHNLNICFHFIHSDFHVLLS